MQRLEARQTEIEQALADADVQPPLLHPALADIYRAKVISLAASLARDDTRAEAAEIVRSLVSRIELTPRDGKLVIDLHGDLAGLLSLAANKKKPGTPGGEAGPGCAIAQASLVAGVGFEPTTFRL